MESEARDCELPLPSDLGCFGCSPSSPVGLRLTFRRRGETVYTRYAIPRHYQGAPGIAHGGIVATILDEVSCLTVLAVRDRYVVTGELSVRYLRPCPVDVQLHISARIAEEYHRYLVVAAEVRQGDVLLARSTGKFFPQQRAGNVP